MSNEKIQSKADNTDKAPRKGRITMGLQRTLATERYQSLVIHYEIDEEIEWQTLEERTRKVQNWRLVMTKEFQDIHDRCLEELALSHKKAYFKDGAESKDPDSVLEDNLDKLDSLE